MQNLMASDYLVIVASPSEGHIEEKVFVATVSVLMSVMS